MENPESLSDIEPSLDALEHYIAAEDFEEAWDLYDDRVSGHLRHLGFHTRNLRFAKIFYEASKSGKLPEWHADEGAVILKMYLGLSGTEESEKSIPFMEKMYELAKEDKVKYKLNLAKDFLIDEYLSGGQMEPAMKLKPSGPRFKAEWYAAKGKYQKALKHVEDGLGKLQEDASFLDDASEHEVNNHICMIARFKIALGQLEGIENSLLDRMEFAREKHFNCCLPNILCTLRDVFLAQEAVADARVYSDKYQRLMEDTEADFEEHSFLLIAEGRYAEAIERSGKDCTLEGEPKWDKSDEIRLNLAIAKANWMLGRKEDAIARLDRAEFITDETGFRRHDWLLEKTRLEIKGEKTLAMNSTRQP